MKPVADQDGQIVVSAINADGDTASFKIGAIDGVPFVPEREVEIEDARLDGVIQTLLAPFGGDWRRA